MSFRVSYDTVYIAPHIEISRDNSILPNIVIIRDKIIGTDCILGPFIPPVDKKIPPGSDIGK